MLAALGSEPFDSPEFRFEVKWDGFRCVAFLESATRLQSRRLHDLTGRYPELADLHLAVRGQPAVLDGEIVALSRGRPDFAALLRRGRSSGRTRPKADAASPPVTFIAFDLLYWRGQSIMAYPLHRRQALLGEAVSETDVLVLSRPAEEEGVAYCRAVFAWGLEGVMAKRVESPYRPGRRTRDWLKLKWPKTLFGVIAGYRRGAEGGVGSLAVALYDQTGKLQLIGLAGVNLPHPLAEDLLAQLASLPAADPPRAGGASWLTEGLQWIAPRLVCRLQYLERTPTGRLRHAVFRELVLRDTRSCTVDQLEGTPTGKRSRREQ
jgi:DNA ligase D-like protein (predicted ligase)